MKIFSNFMSPTLSNTRITMKFRGILKMFITVARARGITKHINYMKTSIYKQSMQTTSDESLSFQHINATLITIHKDAPYNLSCKTFCLRYVGNRTFCMEKSIISFSIERLYCFSIETSYSIPIPNACLLARFLQKKFDTTNIRHSD